MQLWKQTAAIWRVLVKPRPRSSSFKNSVFPRTTFISVVDLTAAGVKCLVAAVKALYLIIVHFYFSIHAGIFKNLVCSSANYSALEIGFRLRAVEFAEQHTQPAELDLPKCQTKRNVEKADTIREQRRSRPACAYMRLISISLFVDKYYSIHCFCKRAMKVQISLRECAGKLGHALSANCIRALFLRCVSNFIWASSSSENMASNIRKMRSSDQPAHA